MTTLEGNKIIAGFMDSNYARSMGSIINFLEKPTPFETTNSFDVTELLYHKSWDWLMPVVEKIESIGGYVRYDTVEVSVYHPGILDRKLDVFSFGRKGVKNQPKMPLLWEGITKFIQWYNQNSK